MSSEDTRQRDERRTRSDANTPFRLAPIRRVPQLIAPNYGPTHSEESKSPLPSVKGLFPEVFDDSLLQKGRGCYVPPPPVRSLSEPGRILTVEGRRLQEYVIKDVTKDKDDPTNHKKPIYRTFVMQQPIANENHAEFTRVDEAGRNITYVLDVAQPPKQARACGNGPRSSADRRPIDPPPVIKLSIFDGKNDITGFYEANFMLYASLEFARPIANNSIYATNHCPVLTGTNCAGAAYLTKPSNAVYFIFPDLSVRHEGFYRLKFHLFEQNKAGGGLAPIPGTPDQANPVVTKPREYENMVNRTFVYSPPFQVFSAKKFPGLEHSTALSMTMSEQGCRVRIRRDVRQRRPDGKKGHKEEDQRSLRAASRDRLDSVDPQDNYSRSQYPADTRRPSIDSQYSQSRQSTHAESTLPSPITPNLAAQYGNGVAAEPQSMWSSGYLNTNMPPVHTLPGPSTFQGPLRPPIARPSYPPISPTAGPPESSRLSISSLTQTSIASLITPTEPARPIGGLYETEPVNKKRALNRSSEERSTGLKDHARPAIERSAAQPKVYGGYANAISHAPLASANEAIEADPNDESTDETDSDFEDTSSYRRANGQRNFMNRNGTVHPR